MKLFFHKAIFFLLLLGGLLPLRAQPAGLEVITSGERKWELLLQDIEGARQTIDLEYYLLADDASGRMIRDALEEKVREGVRVRLLIENVTNFSMRKAYYRQMEASGIDVRILLPRKTGSPPKPSNPVDWTRAGRFIYHVLLASIILQIQSKSGRENPQAAHLSFSRPPQRRRRNAIS